MKIKDKRTKIGELISPRRDKDRPIYSWHAFKHSYSKELVDIFIDEFGLKRGSWVLDPFCGGGTTLLAAKQAGLNAVGFDILPFSVFLSNVKTREYKTHRLIAIRKLFNEPSRREPLIELPDIAHAKMAFSHAVLSELSQIRGAIERIEPGKYRDFFNLGFLSILEPVSNTAKAGGFLRNVSRDVKRGEVRERFLAKVDKMISDLVGSNGNKYKSSVSAQLGDARKIEPDRLYDAVITSPPYPNRHDYTRTYALELYFDFVKSNDELKSIRYDTLRSHVEARKRFQAPSYVRPERLAGFLRRIKRNGTNNTKVLDMLEAYFEDMYLVLSELRAQLKHRGKVALVVSNVRFAGVNLPVDELLSEVGLQAGLNPEAIWLARYRGNSAQQMGTYSRKASRESIIIWEA